MATEEILDYVRNFMDEKYPEYTTCEFIDGHIGNKNVLKNPIYKITNNTQDVVYLLYCEKNTVCELDQKSYELYDSYNKKYTLNNNGKHITYFKAGNGYVYGTNKLALHQIIMNLHGQGTTKDQLSIDHIDRNPLNNKYTNLRIVLTLRLNRQIKKVLSRAQREKKKMCTNTTSRYHTRYDA